MSYKRLFLLGLPVVLGGATASLTYALILMKYHVTYSIERLLYQLTIALEKFRTKSTTRTYHLLPYNLYTPMKCSLDFERLSIASSCDTLLVYNEGLGYRRGDLSLLTSFGESITGQSKNNGLVYEPLAG